ncbi:MAG: nucleotidyltransferase [Bdellovibrionaceae bacterium]|jgi:nucleotidyltransferase substrate binding protein (TIGR01987 family)|nr:nucleotidyltransferase [Pseudobdellovibrionaceae bacterium]
MQKTTRWKQRFDNLESSFQFLEESSKQDSYSRLELGGFIKAFDSCFELSWKTIKDYLEAQGEVTKFAREALKLSFQKEIIEDGHLWLEMLEKRNELSHTYSKVQAQKAIETIKNSYLPALKSLYQYLKSERS